MPGLRPALADVRLSSSATRRTSLPQERHLRPLDVHHRLGEAHRLDRLAHLDPRHRAVEIVPDQPAAGRERVVRLAAVVLDVLEVMPAVDEHKVQRRQPAEVVPHRVGRDEEHLVGLPK